MKKSTYPWLFAVIFLSVTLLIVLYLAYSGYFFSLSMSELSTDLSPNGSYQVVISPNETSVVSFTLDGGYLAGENIPKTIQIKAKNLDVDLNVRVKVEIFNENTQVEVANLSTFSLSGDGYYYYNDALLGGNKVTFCSAIVVPENLQSDERYILNIIVESLDSTLDSETIWGAKE